ncbi:MAG: preprotein translocase subunit SecA [Armatimonadota bacterium]
MNFLRKLFDNNERDVARYRKVVEKVNALEPQFKALNDEQLKGKTEEFRTRVREAVGDEAQFKTRKDMTEAYNKALDDILPEAFAACREASWRQLKMRHFDVQLIGGMVQHDGRISELRTGEGKTLTSTLATYLNAIAGKGVHVVTANDYLVKRDAIWMAPLYDALGMKVGILQGHSPETGEGGGTFVYDPEYTNPQEDGLDDRYKFARQVYDRRDAYSCDIVYATSAELGFDYLRDNMAPTSNQIVQHRGHWFAIIDECDSNLIDEARTPLIISGTAEKSSDLYYVFARIMPMLERGEERKDKYDTTTDEKDYVVDEKQKTAHFSEQGLVNVEKQLRRMGFDVEDISALENVQYMQHANAALKAHAVFHRDRDYVVRQGKEGKPEVCIVDEFTGRIMFGRRWSDGLHQAVEAKEGIKIENEQQTMATITIQNYFRLYAKLAGMTGTAKTEEDEFRKIYALDVVQVPTNKPMVRQDLADVIYKTEEAKLRGITLEILQIHCRKQPVLVGTRSIEMSERVSDFLTFQKLELLGAVTILRHAIDEKKKELGDDYGKFVILLITKFDDLSLRKLEPVAKAVGISVSKMTDPALVAKFADRLGLPEYQRDELLECLMHGIPHNILNAKFHENEARIIAEAGSLGAVTIATNMAGRGVDILLGGTHIASEAEKAISSDESYRRGGRRSIAHVVTKRDAADTPETSGVAGAGTTAIGDDSQTPEQLAAEREAVHKAGGLYILGTERHESRRIDNQLRGRAGRQGDPGSSRFHVSLEDFLWRAFGDRTNSILMKQWEDDQSVDMPILSKMIENAQKKVEQHNFDARKHVLEYDDVMNVQREVIYSERKQILEGADLRETILSYLGDAVDSAITGGIPEGIAVEDYDIDAILAPLREVFPIDDQLDLDSLHGKNRGELADILHKAAVDAFEAREAEMGADQMREIERQVMRQVIDREWVEHLRNMDYLREGIGLRGYAQVDPLVAYKKEALELFNQLQTTIIAQTMAQTFRAQLQAAQPSEDELLQMLLSGAFGQFEMSQEDDDTSGEEASEDDVQSIDTAKVEQEMNLLLQAAAMAPTTAPVTLEPNDPCPCGSGKPYKACHRGRPLPAAE